MDSVKITDEALQEHKVKSSSWTEVPTRNIASMRTFDLRIQEANKIMS